MTRRYGGAPAPRTPRGGGWTGRRALPPPGVLAHHDSTCGMCDQPIQRLVSQVVERKGSWVHVGCVSGADE